MGSTYGFRLAITNVLSNLWTQVMETQYKKIVGENNQPCKI